MSKLLTIQHLIESTRCKIRLKVYHEDSATEWRGGFGLPVEGYIEVAGPERIKDIEWVELDPIVVTHIGRLVPPKVTVATDDIIQVLNDEGIEYAIVRGTIRIYGQSLVSALDERVMDNATAAANQIIKALLVNACVESFGVLHQGHFIHFRNDRSDDMELYISSDMIFYPQQHEQLSLDERILLGMNSVNLKRVVDAWCTTNADLEVHFEDGSWFRIIGTSEDGYEPWQLSDGGDVAEGGILLIASSGDSSYAIWHPDNG